MASSGTLAATLQRQRISKMAKILCTCGQIIPDQSDSIRNKGYIIADQDYMDFFDEVENNGFMEMTGKATKYFNRIFQCDKCNSLIIFRRGADEGVVFIPQDKNGSQELLRSYLGDKWLGTMSANFRDGQGEIYWTTNLESGFRQKLSLPELKELYKNKFEELSKLKILRHSFLRIDDKIEHKFDYEQKSNS